jgi:hypothetical protein
MTDPLQAAPVGAGFRRVFAALCMLALLTGASIGSAETASDAFAEASAAFSQQQYAAALNGFETARMAGMRGPAIEYNIAVCYYKLGNFAAADIAFGQLGERYPAMRPLAEYNRGLALLKLGRTASARAAFQQALSGGDSNIVLLANTMLRGLDDEVPKAAPASRSQEWFKIFDIAVGHDDNVALLEQDSLPAGLSAGSPYTEAFAQIGGPIGALSAWRLDASAYLAKYTDTSAFDQNALRLGGTYRFSWLGWQIESGPYWTRSALDGDGFERRLGVALRMRRPVADAFNMTLQTGYEDIDELESRFAFVAGSRAFVRAGFLRPVEAGLWSLDYRYEQNDRAAAGVSPRRHSLAFAYRHRFSRHWSGEARYAYRGSQYGDLPVPRNEDLSLAGVAALRDLESGWQLVARYELSDNDSDDPLYAYRRQRVSVSIGKAF